MSRERVYQGESKDGKLQDAIIKAIEQLNNDLGEGGVRDAVASWKIVQITGQCGGIDGRNSLKIKISSTRSPEWN